MGVQAVHIVCLVLFGVDIPRNFKIWNEYAKYGNEDLTRKQYDSLKEEEKASNCKSAVSVKHYVHRQFPFEKI